VKMVLLDRPCRTCKEVGGTTKVNELRPDVPGSDQPAIGDTEGKREGTNALHCASTRGSHTVLPTSTPPPPQVSPSFDSLNSLSALKKLYVPRPPAAIVEDPFSWLRDGCCSCMPQCPECSLMARYIGLGGVPPPRPRTASSGLTDNELFIWLVVRPPEAEQETNRLKTRSSIRVITCMHIESQWPLWPWPRHLNPGADTVSVMEGVTSHACPFGPATRLLSHTTRASRPRRISSLENCLPLLSSPHLYKS
jgi:hypothetical protein